MDDASTARAIRFPTGRSTDGLVDIKVTAIPSSAESALPNARRRDLVDIAPIR
jgi:hypothetical protein